MTSRQFTTRSLLRSVAVWAVLLAGVVGITRWQLFQIRHSEAERVLYSRGGTTTRASGFENLRDGRRIHWNRLRRKFHNPIVGIDWSVNSWPRKESKESIVFLPVDDEAVETLWTFKHLKFLNLRGAEITDAGLMHLLSLRKLDKLDISGT